MLTADTITDEQIRQLRDAIIAEGSRGEFAYCVPAVEQLARVALREEPNPDVFPVTAKRIAAARARCAEILNARSAK